MNNKEYFHAFDINLDKCVGCTHCVRVCPTEAIRVHHGKVEINKNRCIDCGKCIVTCKYGVFKPRTDDLSLIKNFKHSLVILSSSFAGQFPDDIPYSVIRETLLKIGFNQVADESEATEAVKEMIREFVTEHKHIRPIISSSCPSIIRLIQVRFPSLLPHVIQLEAPISILTKYYRDKISKEQSLEPEDIGIFLIVPCISQVTAVYQPEGAYKRMQDGAFGTNQIYNLIMSNLPEKYPKENNVLSKGHNWAIASYRADEIADENIRTLAVSGTRNVIKILADIENHQIENFDYIVLSSCINGCVGGILNVENLFVAKARIKRRIDNDFLDNPDGDYFRKLNKEGLFDILPLEPRSIMQLDMDIKSAITKMKKLQEIESVLPGFDCSACGSPSCQSLAEDIVQDKATIDDCLVRMKKIKKKKD